MMKQEKIPELTPQIIPEKVISPEWEEWIRRLDEIREEYNQAHQSEPDFSPAP